MRIPLSWLREYAPVPEDATAEDVLATLVKVGLEEEDVHRPTDSLSGPIVVGQVLTMEPETHSNGRTVNWCTVRVVPEGQEQTLKVKLGRLEDNEKVQQAAIKKDEPAEKPQTQKALGLDLAALSKDLRTRYKIKDSVKGVIVTGVDQGSDAAEKRLSAGDVIVEVAQEAVTSGADIKKRVDQLKKDGKKSVLLLVSNADGELRFVALSLQ